MPEPESRPALWSRLSRQQFFLLTGLASLGLLTGCSDSGDSLAQQADEADSKGYIAGDGSVSEYSQDQRSQPVSFSGTLFDGSSLDAQSLRGKPVLLNFWYAGCAPCGSEAPDLVELYQKYGSQVAFYGVNVRDEAGTAQAFERTFKVEYPSFKDSDGSVLYGLSSFVPAQAVPTTLLLDKEGRVAARILGQIDPSILKTILEEQIRA